MRPTAFTGTPIHLSLLLSLVVAGGCRGAEPTVVEGGDAEVVSRVYGTTQATMTASAQGALYVSIGTTLYRLDDAAQPQLQPLAELGELPTALRVPAEEEVFFISQSSPEIHRWRAATGVESMPTPVRDSVWADGHLLDHINLLDIWAAGPREMYVVGDYAVILRFDGQRWSLEDNPLVPVAQSGTREVLRSYLWSVAGDAGAVYAVGAADVLSRRDGRWAADAPAGTDSVTWWLAMGSPKGTYLVGRDHRTREHLLFHRPPRGEWSRLADRLKPLRHEPVRGSGQPDGSVLFWTAGGEVVRMAGKQVTVYRRLGLESVAAAAVHRNRLYVAGGAGASSVILRLKLEH